MRRQVLHLQGGMSVETSRDWTSRWFVAYKKGVSMFFRDVKSLKRFLALPVKTASRESLDSWLESLSGMDKDNEAPAPEPIPHNLVEGSFDPGAHEEDPALSTKMVI